MNSVSVRLGRWFCEILGDSLVLLFLFTLLLALTWGLGNHEGYTEGYEEGFREGARVERARYVEPMSNPSLQGSAPQAK